MVYPANVTGGRTWRRGVPLAIGLVASGLLATAIADARVVDGCDLKPRTICEEMVLPFNGGLLDEDLSGASFYRSDLSGAYIERTKLVRANLSRTLLNEVLFLRSSLMDANLSYAASGSINFGSLSLSRANLRGVTFRTSSFIAVNATLADLTGAEMPSMTIGPTSTQPSTWADAEFTRAVLTDARITDTSLAGASFADADLRGAELSSVDLSDANLSGVNLSKATLRTVRFNRAQLPVATLVDTILHGADFTGANVSGLVLQDATVRGAFFSRASGNLYVRLSNLTATANDDDYAYPNSLAHSDLRDSEFLDSDLRGVDFTDSDLRNSDFTGSNIRTAIFDSADMRGVILPDSALIGRPTFGCNRQTRWSGDYAERFGPYCRSKGDKVKPVWCRDDYNKTPGLCAICGRICIVGRGVDSGAEMSPAACDRRQQAATRAGPGGQFVALG